MAKANCGRVRFMVVLELGSNKLVLWVTCNGWARIWDNVVKLEAKFATC